MYAYRKRTNSWMVAILETNLHIATSSLLQVLATLFEDIL